MRRRIVAGALITAVVLATIGQADAQSVQPAVVSEHPVSWTPQVLDGTVYALALVGDIVVVGGDFTHIRSASDGPVVDRDGLFAFHLATGEIVAEFDPQVDGPVRALADGPAGTVYVGGQFTTISDHQQRNLAQLRVLDGQPVPTFNASTDGEVDRLTRRGNDLYAGGRFTQINTTGRSALARLDTTTGTLDPNFDLDLDHPTAGELRVQDLAVTPDGTRLVIDGTFTTVSGQPRHQLALIDTSTTPARLADWTTTVYADTRCKHSDETYLRGVDLASDGNYFVVVTSGHTYGADNMCDTAARFETTGTGEHQPTWINHTGGNTLLTVAVTGAAVYVGGHEQWLDNPEGKKNAGPGAVERPGIGAIDPTTGQALQWNPTRDRGVGVQALLAYPGGLIVGSDTENLAHERHPRLGLFPTP